MKVQRSRKLIYTNWDSEIWTFELDDNDLKGSSNWQKLSIEERMMVMEAKLSQMLYGRLLASKMITQNAYDRVVGPVEPLAKMFDELQGGPNGGNEKAG